MIRKIAFKELLSSVLTLRFAIIVLVCCLLVPISATVLSNDYLAEQSDYEGRLELEAERGGGKNQQVKVFRRVPQLMALFRGVAVNSVNGLELNDDPWFRHLSSAVQSPTEAVFPTVDLTFIIGFVLSALAMILAFDGISGEKAGATLRLLMANGVPRSSVFIGKWVGLTATIVIPFILGMVISLIIFFAITGAAFGLDVWLALAICLFASLLYLSVFVLLGLAVSAFTSTPTQSIFVGLGVWGLLTILLPQIAVAAADFIDPVPSVKEVEKNMRLANNDHLLAVRSQNMEMTAQAKAEGWPFERVRQERRNNEYPKEISHRHRIIGLERDYWQKVRRQESLGRNLALASPFGSINQALIALAATGPESQWHFIDQAYVYGAWYFDELVKDPAVSASQERAEALATFTYEPLPVSKRIEFATVPMASLAIMNVLLVIIGIIAFNRYDVR